MNFKRFLVYLFRWQLSTIVLAPVVAFFANAWIAAIIANLIGGCIFYWIDRFIFNSKSLSVEWEVKYGECSDCGRKGRVYRIRKGKKYDRSNDKFPKFRCEKCSIIKEKELEELL